MRKIVKSQWFDRLTTDPERSRMDQLPKLLVIVGPTASGKSSLAVEIAQKFDGEIISADSRQIYRGMDIGTAKSDKKDLVKIKHHLVNIRNINQEYSVAEFKKYAINIIRKILKNGKLPILVGGTGLYIDAVVKNLEIPEIKEDKELRSKLEKEIETYGLDYVFRKLVNLDPEAAYIVDPKNPRRIIRALEIAILTGKPFSSQRNKGNQLFKTLILGIKQDPEILKNRIHKRTKQMLDDGLIQEVKKLIKKYGETQKPFDAIGYREIIDYLNGKKNLSEAEDLINKNSWHYAKRQITWFKRNKQIHWIKDKKEAFLLTKRFLD
ncbi:MAG TPA: tRNA (adenosine(37)-N6)-dimethylallyltransferase MiaA [Candidatus Paceibacterota bacterium]